MRLLACNDGESWGLSDTLCASATVSNCGTKTFVSTARLSQNSAIGTENRRIKSGTEFREVSWRLIRIYPGST